MSGRLVPEACCIGCGRVTDILLCVECGPLAVRLAARLRDGGYPDPAGFDIDGWLVPIILSELTSGKVPVPTR